MINFLHVLSRGPVRLFERFRGDERASLSVEAVLVLPLLIWAFAASYGFFDVFRARSLALKGNYAISDLLSRETNTIDMSYLNGAKKVFKYLTQAGSDSWMRVTVVHCTANCSDDTRTLAVNWSKGTDSAVSLTDDDIMNHYEKIIPLMASGEEVIIVETSMAYTPPFPESVTGVSARDFVDTIMTRPRFAEQLCFSGIGCGI